MIAGYCVAPGTPEAAAIACVLHEGHLLDDRRWDDWLALYDPGATFWLPAWRDEDERLDSPEAGVSLIYHDSRGGLEDRVGRVRSGKSVTTMPLPRTTHLITAPRARLLADRTVEVDSRWMVWLYQPRTAKLQALAGHYRHRIGIDGETCRILAKTITLMNDEIPTQLDFYAI